MMRSLYTAATGMTNQMLHVDVIANNLSNVNTIGYKKERLEFQTLLYQTMQRANLDEANQTGRPVNLQVGHGVKSVATSRTFTTGNLEATGNPLDFAIEGESFFVVSRGEINGEQDIVYTRDGALKFSVGNYGTLVTSDGYLVLNTEGEPITIPTELGISTNDIIVDETGTFFYLDGDNMTQPLDMQFALVQFPNRQGLDAIGQNFYRQTSASGEPLSEFEGETTRISRVRQRYIEMSNVMLADEMVDLIIAQRAYETNSKVITTSDEMLQTANGLKR